MSDQVPDTIPEDPHALVALLTPIPNGEVLAAICALNRCHGEVLEISAGTLAVMDNNAAGSADDAARAVSTLLRDHPLLALERRDGQIAVTRWQGGSQGESLAPGLALDEAPSVVTSLMSGATTVDTLKADHADRVFDARMGRFKAFRKLRKLSRQAKRKARGQ